jgi:hypothetical protein
MKIELFVVGLIGLTLIYENYIKHQLTGLYAYGKSAMFLGLGAYLVYLYMYKPTEYYTVLEMVKDYLLNNTFNTPLKNINQNFTYTNKKDIRNVTGLMKKKVAANQKWQCGHCKSILEASYEVDHILALYKGGTNDESNLIALCRNCHGNKTVNERLN